MANSRIQMICTDLACCAINEFLPLLCFTFALTFKAAAGTARRLPVHARVRNGKARQGAGLRRRVRLPRHEQRRHFCFRRLEKQPREEQQLPSRALRALRLPCCTYRSSCQRFKQQPQQPQLWQSYGEQDKPVGRSNGKRRRRRCSAVLQCAPRKTAPFPLSGPHSCGCTVFEQWRRWDPRRPCRRRLHAAHSARRALHLLGCVGVNLSSWVCQRRHPVSFVLEPV